MAVPGPCQWRTETVGFNDPATPDQVVFYTKLTFYTPTGEHVTFWTDENAEILREGIRMQMRLTGQAQAEHVENIAIRTARQALGDRGGGGA